MPPGTPAFTASGTAEYPGGGGGTVTAIDPSIVVPGDFQNGTYNFPGGLEIGGQPVLVSGGALNANEITPGEFATGVYDFPSVGGLTVAGAPVYTRVTANDVNPGTFSGPFNFTQGPTVNNQAIYYRNQGQAQGVLGTDVALDTISGGPGTGVGNIKAASIYGFNIQPGSLTYDLLSGVAQSQVLAFTVQDTPFSFLRRVSQTGSQLDANGKETDGFTALNAATRVADPQAYNAYAITNAGMATGVQAVGGPGVPLQPGQYVVNVFLRVSAQTGSNVLSVQATGANVSGPVVTVKGSDLGTSYIGIAVPFTVTAAGASVSLNITNLIASGTAQWWFSHAHADPSTGKATQAAAQFFFANAAITAAQIETITATQIVSGLINADNIFMGPGGHVYMGPQVGPISGNTARVEINSAGLFAYDGTNQTVAIRSDGTVNIKASLTIGSNVPASTVAGTVASASSASTVPASGVTAGTLAGGVAVPGGNVSGAVASATSATNSSNLTGGSISGTNTVTGVVNTGAGTARVEITSAGLKAYNSGGTNTVSINSDGSASFTGSVNVSATGSSVPASTVSGTVASASSASTVPAAGVTGGTLPGTVTVPAGNVSGTVASATNATNVPAGGVTSGTLSSGVAVPAGNVSGTVASAATATNASNLTGGTVSGNNAVSGYLSVGDPSGAHVIVGNDGRGANGVRLYAADNATVSVDLNIGTGIGTITGGTITGGTIQTAASGNNIRISSSAGDVIWFMSMGAATPNTATAGSGNPYIAGSGFANNASPFLELYGGHTTGSTQTGPWITMSQNGGIYIGAASIELDAHGGTVDIRNSNVGSGPTGSLYANYVSGTTLQTDTITTISSNNLTLSALQTIFQTATHGCSITSQGGMPGFGSAGQDNFLSCRAATNTLGSTNYVNTVWGRFLCATGGYGTVSTVHSKADIEPLEHGWALDVIRKAPSYKFKSIHGDFHGSADQHPDHPDFPVLSNSEDWHFGPIYEDLHDEVRDTDEPTVNLGDLIGVLWAHAGDAADIVDDLLRRVAALERAGKK